MEYGMHPQHKKSSNGEVYIVKKYTILCNYINLRRRDILVKVCELDLYLHAKMKILILYQTKYKIKAQFSEQQIVLWRLVIKH